MATQTSIPGTFIIESNQFDDEEDERQEGRVLKEVLRLTGRPVLYRYIRTRKELGAVLAHFAESRYRYLHLACHGSGKGIALTLDYVDFVGLAELLAPLMNKRRLFISACDSTRRALAEPLFRRSTCYSVIGPRGRITFPDAAMTWAAFYSVMSKASPKVMKRSEIERRLCAGCKVFGVRFNAFFRNGSLAEFVVLG
jgi:hypothetical protein